MNVSIKSLSLRPMKNKWASCSTDSNLYTPQTIALLGVMLEILHPNEDTAALFKKLNPMTVYKLSISQNILPTQKNMEHKIELWKIP